MTDDSSDRAPLVVLAPKRWVCCDCGGTGVDSLGQTCELCEGLGFC
ncbi:hypothetical protein HS048_02380 [Planomonospora sp. ID91781]|nr:hypothetical protein [Planomonospora sp. ID91781]MBG0819606.1 hypothetical protein [Planomonospora sp. ID91781]